MLAYSESITQMIKNAWVTKKCVFVHLILCSVYIDVYGRFVQYWLAHADLKRGFSVSFIVVYSEGMSKVNDICASEVAI